MAIKALRGTKDILPEEAPYFHMLEDTARRVFERYGYSEIRTPMFEATELFARGIGEETDIVSKEMYTFEDRKGRSLTLRPEGTAPAVRAMIEHGLLKQQGVQQKVYYLGPMFRYERPQAGRQRQFNTAGVEFFGCDSALADAEVIAMLDTYLTELGFEKTTTKINTIGNAPSRQAYNAELRRQCREFKDKLCGDCQRRSEVNPLRVLDCKVPTCQEIYADFPLLSGFLDEESRQHYALVKETLDRLQIDYEEDPRLVRGFDYYSHTVFESRLEGLGAQDAAAGGGRYDGLVEQLGGPNTPAVGFGFGLERLILAMQAAGIQPPALSDERSGVYILALDDAGLLPATILAEKIRDAGHPAAFEFKTRSIKAGFKAANREHFRYIAILGPEELAENKATLKDLETGEETKRGFGEVVGALVEEGA